MKRIGLLSVLLGLFVAASVHAQVTGVSAELTMDQDQYLPGEDLHLKVRVLNRSGQTIYLGHDNDWITLSIANQNGLPCVKFGDMPVKGDFSLESGEVGAKALNPTPYFDFRQLGRYRITGTVKIPQWHQEIPCKGVYFNINYGVTLPNMANLQIGLPPAAGVTNALPEIRKYSLLHVNFLNEMKLYFRLTDVNDRVLKVFPIAPMMSFSEPQAQIDRYNNFHVLHQTGARSFNYDEISPEGGILERRTYMDNGIRPELKINNDGRVVVVGGVREPSLTDLPPGESAQTP